MAQRYFVDEIPEPGRLDLQGDVAHHLGTVLRCQPGAIVQLGDGRGATAEARVVAVARGHLQLQILARVVQPAPAIAVHVAFAPPRLARAEWLFEHGTEVGIAAFHPLWTSRTRPQGEKPERWQKIVVAAAGQCDRAHVPTIAPLQELTAFLQRTDLPAQRFLAAASAPTLAGADPGHGDVLLLVGPEGGFSPAEAAAAVQAGFQPRGLGPHTLRTETAALVGAALLLAR
jgi:16S rRNA (uracil1498-N3)-methyltransferase